MENKEEIEDVKPVLETEDTVKIDIEKTDTNLIINHVNETKVEKKENKLLKLIVTILVTLLVGYMGIYTIYNVFFAPEPEEETVVTEEDKINEPVVNLLERANNAVIYIPHVNNLKGAYQSVEGHFFGLPEATIKNTIVRYIEESNEITADTSTEFNDYKALNCPDETLKKCFSVTYSQMDEAVIKLYGTAAKIDKSEFLLNNNLETPCTLASNGYYCVDIVTDIYSGKVSVIENVKSTEEELYIYEYVGFITNMVTVDNNGTYTYTAESFKNEAIPDLVTISDLNVPNSTEVDYNRAIYNSYQSSFKLYKSTFKLEGDNLIWLNTNEVKSINE